MYGILIIWSSIRSALLAYHTPIPNRGCQPWLGIPIINYGPLHLEGYCLGQCSAHPSVFLSNNVIIPPAQWSCWGVYWFHSIRPSIRPSRVRLTSVPYHMSQIVLVGSISYLCILPSNFRRCVTCKVSCKISIFGNFLKFVTLSCFNLGSDVNH